MYFGFMFRNALLLVLASFFALSCKKEQVFSRIKISEDSHSWMYDLMVKYPQKDITLSNFALPGSHDAGVYVLNKCSFGANSCNTQTQTLNFTKQLEAGYRIFDVRLTTQNGKYVTHHTSECGGLGCQGESYQKLLDMTNNFLNENREVVILLFSHFCSMSPTDAAFIEYTESILGDKIYKETERVEKLGDWNLKTILGENPTTGKVILVFDGGVSNTDENRQNGLFSVDAMRTYGGWSNKFNYSELKADQLNKFNAYDPNSGLLFEFSWQMTQDAALAVSCALGDNKKSILNMSKESNPDFQIVIDSMIQSGAIHTQKHPNIFWLDHGDKWMKDIAIRISEIGFQK